MTAGRRAAELAGVAARCPQHLPPARSRSLTRFTRGKLLAAIDGSVDIVGITDLEGNVKMINKAFSEITGCKPKEIIGKRFTKVQPKKDAPQALNAFKEIIEKGSCETFDLDFLSKDGHIINTLAAGVLLRDEQRRPVEAFLAAKDVTDRKKAETRLEESEKKHLEKKTAPRRFKMLGSWLEKNIAVNAKGRIIFKDKFTGRRTSNA